MMKFLVIGIDGQVGQEFRKHLSAECLAGLDLPEIDVTDIRCTERVLKEANFDACISLAAFHDVNGCEDNPSKAFQVNAVGISNVGKVCAELGKTVCFFSSDYVFGLDEGRDHPYLECDPVGPLSHYGMSKVAGEMLLRAATENHLIVRTSSLFGAVTSKKGHTFPEMILKKARDGDPLKVVNDQYMSPTYTFDLVEKVIQCVRAGLTGTVHVTGGDGCTWHEFAVETLKLSSVDHPIAECSSDEFPAKARRPQYSRLDSRRMEPFGITPMRDWREGLEAYLEEKGKI